MHLRNPAHRWAPVSQLLHWGTWEPGSTPVLAGRASVKRLDFGVRDGDWADTGIIPNEVAVSTRVTFVPAP